ncbi:hypothetical protein ACFE04_019302 [Oxalis oulophora]
MVLIEVLRLKNNKQPKGGRDEEMQQGHEEDRVSIHTKKDPSSALASPPDRELGTKMITDQVVILGQFGRLLMSLPPGRLSLSMAAWFWFHDISFQTNNPPSIASPSTPTKLKVLKTFYKSWPNIS